MYGNTNSIVSLQHVSRYAIDSSVGARKQGPSRNNGRNLAYVNNNNFFQNFT